MGIWSAGRGMGRDTGGGRGVRKVGMIFGIMMGYGGDVAERGRCDVMDWRMGRRG